MEKGNYLENNIKTNCTGCGACEQTCPKNCITMVEDSEGFKYPVINKKECINCKKCLRTCPVSNEIENNNAIEEEKFYAFKDENEKKLLESASGGAFYNIALEFCKGRYAIFGAKIDENLKVTHDYVTDIKEIGKFKKSKYVQSNIGKSYIYVKEFLENGYRVLFTGTPCQIAGLRKYLMKNYENLLCVDIICHGVPSQKLFDMYIETEEKANKGKIKKVNFREKVFKKGSYSSKNIKLCFENGKEIIKDSEKSSYLKGFQNALYYRPSCYECKFASAKRYSDITISDCWGIEKISKKLDLHKGVSMIIIHTDKGLNVLNNNRFKNKILLNKNFAIKNNSQYSKPAHKNKNREKFFSNLTVYNFENKVKKLTKKTFYNRIINKIKYIYNKIKYKW